MIHISKFGVKERVANAHDVAKLGEMVKVRVYGVDKEKGRISLEKMVIAEPVAETKTETK